jgi:hypothetical protein
VTHFQPVVGAEVPITAALQPVVHNDFRVALWQRPLRETDRGRCNDAVTAGENDDHCCNGNGPSVRITRRT